MFHNVFNFLSVPGQISLKVRNIPGTAEVLVLNLTRTCFIFQTGNILIQIKLSANYLSVYLLSAQMSYLGIVLYLRAFVFNVVVSI